MTARVGAYVALTIMAIASLGTAAGPDDAGFLPDGYLNLVDVVPPAPIPQEPRGVADRELFKLTRSLKGSQRWDMAIGDAPSDTATMMRAFACAARVSMTPAKAPKTASLLEKVSRDTAREADELKSYYKKRRPFLLDSGETCRPRTDGLAIGYDYPSAQATRGWTWALVLGELLDDRAAPIMARGRAYGESGIVCGVHNMSAVEAARMAASATLTVVRTEPSYREAVVAARNELAALRKTTAPPSAQLCSNEEVTVNQPIFR